MKPITDQRIIEWLLQGDPAIRWQTLRDLTDSSDQVVAREQHRVGTTGWGARLLRRQATTGWWGGGLYSPKWTSTTYTTLLLQQLGLPRRHSQALRACEVLLEYGVCRDGGINYGGAHDRAETCVTGMVLGALVHFGWEDDRLEDVIKYLLDHQMHDGGWNCRLPYGATHGSMHTTILVLEGLHEVEHAYPRYRSAVRRAQQRGREFLLAHRLFRSHRTGQVINPAFTRFCFPPRWHYDILRALDYFRASRAPRDKRLAEAVAIVEQRRRTDGRWRLPRGYAGHVFFELEQAGQPSRWNTLRALRVLRWWNNAENRKG